MDINKYLTPEVQKYIMYLIFGFVLLETLWEIYLDLRQILRHTNSEITKETEAWVTPEEFSHSNEYTITKMKFDIFKLVYSLITTAIIIFGRIYPHIWHLSVQLCSKMGVKEDSEIIHSLVFMTIQTFIEELVALPLSYYQTFSIEARYNFNKQTNAIFFSDFVKNLAVNIVTMLPLVAGLLSLLINHIGGDYYWLIAWFITITFVIALQIIYPIWIMPLFNKFSPLADDDVVENITELCNECNFPLDGLFEIDGSKRSGKSNAFFIGLCGNRRVVLFDTLVDLHRKAHLLEPKHITAIVGHEIGHSKHNHLWKRISLIFFQMFLLFFGFSVCIDTPLLYTLYGFDSNEKHAFIGILGFMFLMSPVGSIITLLVNIFTRKFEYQADEYAAKRGYDLGTPLVILHTENLSDLNPDPIYSWYHFSHPSLAERLEALHWKPTENLIEKRAQWKILKKELDDIKEQERQAKLEEMMTKSKDKPETQSDKRD
ncbi:putative CAAX prenyl protease 1 like protein [Blattamonas nauphoetae]|uniref:CAAX prenyl protease n=1 Tax=Blattamonas nauphoetae TaxID=2049346 RepID=A0ABQ9XT61_9EUKA|nr:putative CAAX prenyl protease 1 like protein [Blattamonas nauphoetae]